MGKRILSILFAVMAGMSAIARADGPGRIYTKPADDATGVITGKVEGAALTHAIAIERDRARVYLAELDAAATGFRFTKLPVGRFDLVLVTKDGRVIEGLALGTPAALPEDRANHLAERVAKADSFFNRHVCHRIGHSENTALVFAERIRDKEILRGSGEKIDASLRRLEIVELQQAGDDWQMVRSRHLYREEAPLGKDIPFLSHTHLPSLSGLRVASTPRDLGVIQLAKP